MSDPGPAASGPLPRLRPTPWLRPWLLLRPGLRLAFILAVSLFALVAGAGSALVELASTTRHEVDAAVTRAQLAGTLVVSQIGAAVHNAPGTAPAEVIRIDPRIGSGMLDLLQYTPSVIDVMIADTSGVVLRHTDTFREGQIVNVRPELVPKRDAASLSQFASILQAQYPYEVRVPFLIGDDEFGTVRVGISPGLLRGELREVLNSHILKLAAQVLLASLFGIAVSWIVVLRPLGRIGAGIEHLQRGDFSHRVPIDTPDELGQLARQINALSEALRVQREQFVHQRDEGDNLRRLVDAVDDGLLMIDSERRVLMANRTACGVLGADFQHLSGKDLAEAVPAGHPLIEIVDAAFRGPTRLEASPIEFRNGSGARVFLASCQVVGEGENRRGAMISLRDYGRVRRIQEMLDHARVLSRLGKMAAGVAHEIRNPLNAMNIHLTLLRGKIPTPPVSADGEDHLKIVQREIARLERVVYGFLRLARLQELSVRPIPVEPFLREMVELVQSEARMAGLRIAWEMTQGTPDLYGDEELLRQSFLNLLKNAIQASPPGSGPITVSASPDGRQVRLEVSDQGQGMPPDVIEKAFDLYYTTKKEGSGVGLALVQQTVEMHGGRIDIESAVGVGTKFSIRLPAFSEDHLPMAPEPGAVASPD
jgi:signal transduction histidine kinase/HAMP domain-containing protein